MLQLSLITNHITYTAQVSGPETDVESPFQRQFLSPANVTLLLRDYPRYCYSLTTSRWFLYPAPDTILYPNSIIFLNDNRFVDNNIPGLCVLLDAVDLIHKEGQSYLVVLGWCLADQLHLHMRERVILYESEFCVPLNTISGGILGYIRYLPFGMARRLVRLRHQYVYHTPPPPPLLGNGDVALSTVGWVSYRKCVSILSH